MFKKFIENSNVLKEDEDFLFTNYYINLFNILLLIDCNNNDKDITIIYNGNNIYYTKEKDEDIISIIREGYAKECVILYAHELFHRIDSRFLFNPMISIFKISNSTLDLLINSNILNIDARKSYDILARKINELTIIAQENLETYLKDYINKDYNIYDLYNNYLLSYYSEDKEINKVVERIYKIVEYNPMSIQKCIYCDYNEVFNIYLDNIKLVTLYTKYITEFQVKYNNSNETINSKIKDVINLLGLFSIRYKDIIDNIESIKSNGCNFIKNGTSFKDARNLVSNLKELLNNDTIFLNTLYSIPNSIFNLLSNLNTINKIIKTHSNELEELILYKPKFNNLSKDGKNIYIISKIINDSNIIDKYVQKYISIINNNVPFEYGLDIKYSNGDISESLLIDDILSRYDENGILDRQYINSIFNGYIQNNVLFNSIDGKRIKYYSSVWLKPLYKNETILTDSIQNHLSNKIIPLSYNKFNYYRNIDFDILQKDRGSYYQLLYDFYKKFCGTNLMNTNTPYLETHEPTGDAYTSDKNGDKNVDTITSYQIKLGSTFMLRGYIIGILEMISRFLNISSLQKLNDKELKEFKKAYSSNNSYTVNMLVNDFKNNNNVMKYSKNGENNFSIPSENQPVKQNRYIRTFYSFFMDTLHLNNSMLDKINTIAKEDYLTCPMM